MMDKTEQLGLLAAGRPEERLWRTKTGKEAFLEVSTFCGPVLMRLACKSGLKPEEERDNGKHTTNTIILMT
jgi:hypothetical protein